MNPVLILNTEHGIEIHNNIALENWFFSIDGESKLNDYAYEIASGFIVFSITSHRIQFSL